MTRIENLEERVKELEKVVEMLHGNINVCYSHITDIQKWINERNQNE